MGLLDLADCFDDDRPAVPRLPDLSPDDLPPEWREVYHERAVIREVCGGLARELAEHDPLLDTLELMQTEEPYTTDSPTSEATTADATTQAVRVVPSSQAVRRRTSRGCYGDSRSQPVTLSLLSVPQPLRRKAARTTRFGSQTGRLILHDLPPVAGRCE